MSFYKSSYSYKILEVLIVSSNLELASTLKLILLLLKASYDYKHFLVVDLVVIFSRDILLRKEDTRSYKALVINLYKYATYCLSKGVSLEYRFLIWVEL